MEHMWEDDREFPEVLGKEYDTLISSIDLLDRFQDTSIRRSESIDSDAYIIDLFWILDFCRESWILQTEESIIDTFIECILLLALDTSTRCDDFSLIVECDKNRHLRFRIFEE